MNNFNLQNKTILITGASSGIGSQTAIQLSRAGAKVVVCGRNGQRLQKTYTTLSGKEHVQLIGDLTIEKEISAIAESTPSLDGLVLCAGQNDLTPIKYIESQTIDHLLKSNFIGHVLLIRELLKKKKLNKKASLVFVSTLSTDYPTFGGSIYAATKAALEAFCRSFALEYKDKSYRANIVSAALVKTKMFEKLKSSLPEEHFEKELKKYPLGIGEPEDIANAAIYLLSDASRWMTGMKITLDGGTVLNR